FVPVQWDVGYVHGGFAHALDLVSNELDAAIGRLSSGCRVWFTGHSLGAALATLAAYRYRSMPGRVGAVWAGVDSFGAALVGNGVFGSTFDAVFEERSIRYVNDHDVVTHVPPGPFALPHGLFTHVDHLRWINKDGQIGTTPPTLPHFVSDVLGCTNVL